MAAASRGGAESFRSVLTFTFRHWRRQAPLVALVASAMLLSTLADVFMPVFAGRIVDAVALDGADKAAGLHKALWALGAMVGLGVLMAGLRYVGFAGISEMTLRIMTRVGQDAFWRIQRFSTDWHANNFAGSTVRKITRGMWALDLMDDTLLLSLLPSLVVLLGSTLLLGWHWPVMGLLVALGSIGYIALTVSLSILYVAPSARLANIWDTRLGGLLADAVSCISVVKGFGAEWREDARLASLLGKWRGRTYRSWMRGTSNSTLQTLVLLVLRVAVIGLVLWLWWQDRASPGDIAYVLTTFFLIQGYLRDIGLQVRNLQRSVNDMEELVAFHADPLGVADAPGARPIRIAAGGIVFDHVNFHYGKHETPLYSDLDVAIRPGERVGLVGHSGSGKTTFVKLIQRLYDLSGGRILIDGQDIADVTQASLRQQIAIVQQEPILFHRSLAENIAYGRPDASQGEIEHAARLANAHDFILRLPKGYGTLVGERGIKLSGGERQRVALARAFLADAPILILDEATASLDSVSEALIQEAMERLMQGRTTIVIAHRLSTVRTLDRILVFDRGRIMEEGTHGELVARERGIYRSLFERQAMDLAAGLQVA
ncbi:ATP-binding cassette, subfamily B [Faunimonas pinastri]|uniref:ATP-binding cassette, subfamily B n=1 Tax=Faunimonas pinastri TaxID=1855383 RepID=A0A1H9KZC4_9HYPH|nr:ABC transporter ATP-binding protein [Faunimonas pinastri]SER04133.1 ATP-binding cassette, subfamily B [Faunimonas pinastri]